MELMEGDAGAPALGQRDRRVVRAQDLVQVRGAEQGQHRQVGLPVAAVRGRVDQRALAARPEHVARPQVTVDPTRRLGGPASSRILSMTASTGRASAAESAPPSRALLR